MSRSVVSSVDSSSRITRNQRVLDSFGCHASSFGRMENDLRLCSAMAEVSLEEKADFWAVLSVKGREREMCKGKVTPSEFSRRLCILSREAVSGALLRTAGSVEVTSADRTSCSCGVGCPRLNQSSSRAHCRALRTLQGNGKENILSTYIRGKYEWANDLRHAV
jgi:hypothetical protein